MSCVYFQLQKKMSMIHQEVQSLRHRLDARKYDTGDDDRRLMTRMEGLKEQFRELLVEMRKRKAAESELAMSFCDEDSAVRIVACVCEYVRVCVPYGLLPKHKRHRDTITQCSNSYASYFHFFIWFLHLFALTFRFLSTSGKKRKVFQLSTNYWKYFFSCHFQNITYTSYFMFYIYPN